MATTSTQYSIVRETMAAIYFDDETLLGPTQAPNWPQNFGQLSQEDQFTGKKELKMHKYLIVKGKSRIQEKTKEISQLLCRVHAVEWVNCFLSITRTWPSYEVVLLILSLWHLEFLVESWMTNIKSFLQIYNNSQNI